MLVSSLYSWHAIGITEASALIIVFKIFDIKRYHSKHKLQIVWLANIISNISNNFIVNYLVF